MDLYGGAGGYVVAGKAVVSPRCWRVSWESFSAKATQKKVVSVKVAYY